MSGLRAKKGEHFVETKVFEVLDPSGTYVLTDENGEAFTIEMYAPQSDHMREYDKRQAEVSLQRNARSNGAAGRNYGLLEKQGAMRMSHAIKAWHPVSPDGEFLKEYADASVKERADLLVGSGEKDSDITWLTDQIVDFFNKGNFVILRDQETEAPKPIAKTKTTTPA